MSWPAVAMMAATVALKFISGLLTKPVSTTDPQAASYRVTTAVSGLTKPVLFGTNRIQANMIWYGDYLATPHTSKVDTGGKGFSPGGQASHTSWTYSASFMLGLCYGEVTKILKAWAGKDVIDLYPKTGTEKFALLGLTSQWTVLLGTQSQAAWPYMVSKHPTEAIRYPNLAIAACANYNMGDVPSLPNFSFVMQGAYNEMVPTHVEEEHKIAATVEVIHLEDFVTNISVKFTGGATLVEMTGAPDLNKYSHDGLGTYTFNAGNIGQAITITYEYGNPRGAVPDTILTQIITNKVYALAQDASLMDTVSLANYRAYCLANDFVLSPFYNSQSAAKDIVEAILQLTNSEIVASGGKIKVIPYGDEPVGTWTPDLTSRYTITLDDIEDKDDATVKVSRDSSADAFNTVTLQISDSGNDYNNVPVEYKEQADIEDNGARPMSPISAPGIITKSMALKVAKLICKRSLANRNTISFELPWNFCLLEPMDLITITVPHHGYVNQLIRIISIAENNDGMFSVEAEEMEIGTATAPTKEPEPSSGFIPNYSVIPGDANDPLMFVPPTSLSITPQVWMATSGGADWGGCHIWVSQDDTTYLMVGTIIGKARYGELTADLPSSLVSPDTTNTLSVDLTVSGGGLDSATEDEADFLRSLCYVDGEYIAYTEATLTALYQYDLVDYLVRGCHGSAMALHSTGSNFVRLDEAIFKHDIQMSDIGKTLYIKLQSFNQFGKRLQDLADLTAHTYVVQSPGDMINAGINNLAVNSNSASPDTKIDISFDSADIPSPVGDVFSAGALGFTIDAATVGINGLDVGSVAANTWYYVHIIANPVQRLVAGLCSLSPTAPTLPTGYTHFVVCSAFRADADADFIPMNQVDLEAFYEGLQIQDTDATAENWTDQDLDALVPPIATRAYLSFHAIADAIDVNLKARKNGTSTTGGQISGLVLAGDAGQVNGWVDTDTSQVVEISVDVIPYSWTLYVSGFRFNL